MNEANSSKEKFFVEKDRSVVKEKGKISKMVLVYKLKLNFT